MPSEMKLWRIEGDTPKPVSQDKLDLESRLEDWIRDDIGLVNDDLLVIGQQVPTEHTGEIDLLAIDSDANLVILELKRDRTPRDIVAQILDYASYVQNLGLSEIQEIAAGADFLRGKDLEEAFREKFGFDLPEFVNQAHRMYIVASALDSATERIVEYLSETHGVDINVATFAYFNVGDQEMVGRSMLLEEGAVQSRAVTRGGSKRMLSPTMVEFQAIAKENGVGELWDRALEGFGSIPQLSTGRRPHQLNINVKLDQDTRPVWVLSMFPEKNSEEDGLSIMVEHVRIGEYLGLSPDAISEMFPDANEWDYSTYSFDADRLDRLVDMLKQNVPQV